MTNRDIPKKLIRDIMTKDPYSVPEGTPVVQAIREMAERNFSSIIVVSKKRHMLRGIVTGKEVIDARGHPGGLTWLAEALVDDLMIREPDTLRPGDSVFDAAHLMDQLGVDHIIVEENGTIAGIVSQGDVLNAISDELLSLDKHEPS